VIRRTRKPAAANPVANNRPKVIQSKIQYRRHPKHRAAGRRSGWLTAA
jgi:hypothetical protein